MRTCWICSPRPRDHTARRSPIKRLEQFSRDIASEAKHPLSLRSDDITQTRAPRLQNAFNFGSDVRSGEAAFRQQTVHETLVSSEPDVVRTGGGRGTARSRRGKNRQLG